MFIPDTLNNIIESDLSISYSNIYKLLKKMIHKFPYKMTKFQHLRDDDKTKWVEFAQWCKHRMWMNPNFLSSIYQCSEHANLWDRKPTRSTRVREAQWQIDSVVRNSLRRRVRSLLHRQRDCKKRRLFWATRLLYPIWSRKFPENALFQQGGAPRHTGPAARSLLADIFCQNWKGKYRPTTRSPDLTPPDFSWEDMLKIKYSRLRCKT